MPCTFTNSRGKQYHLHRNGKIFYFSREEQDSIEKPEGYLIVENKRTGLPMLKKE